MGNTLPKRDWESQFSSWSSPPSQSEKTRCENAESAVKKAIAASPLKEKDITVFAQGSYRNRTNIPSESDVDICIRLNFPFFHDLPANVSMDQANLFYTGYYFDTFKSEVEAALKNYFNRGVVTRGNKAFDIKENTYKVSADAVPTFAYHDYYIGNDGKLQFRKGTKFIADDGKEICNWPEQNYANGVAKNERTQQRFKAVVRILKNLCIEMRENGIEAANGIPSYFIECLVWNVPDEYFSLDTYQGRVRDTLAYIFNETRQVETCKLWTEENGVKYLFHSTQPWKQSDALRFADAAWNYIGYV